MAKIFRISGYLVSKEEKTDKDGIEDYMNSPTNRYGFLNWDEMWQQLHVEESERFELDGEDKENCDLALITRHFKKDNSNKQFDRPLPVAGEKYKHFKLGKIVTVIGISRHTETEEITVVYEYEGTIWNRPLEMFMSEVDREKYKNVSQKYRFEKVESEEVSMIENEAIELLTGQLTFNELNREAKEMAIQALEKQIPKKTMQGEPFWWIDTVKVKGRNKQVRKKSYSHVCPCCGKGVAMLSNVFCNHCGQKLDWSE